MISLHNISYSYDRLATLSNISLTIQKGEILCILGPSGAGKSTLLRIICGLIKEYTGIFSIDNIPAHQYFKQQRIAFVAQKYSNFQWFTVEENISLASPQISRTQLDIFLKDLGLYGVKDKYISTLSGGMQQRVAIGRAFLQDTSIIALDEPFGALDAETKILMQEFLLRQLEKSQRTAIIVTHDIEEALYLGDKIIVLGEKPARIVQNITVTTPLSRETKDRFSPIFETQKRSLYSILRSEQIKLAFQTPSELHQSSPLTIGLSIWPGSMPFFLGQNMGLFTNAKLPILLQSFANHQHKMNEFHKGNIDILQTTLDTWIQLKDQYPEYTLLHPLALSTGADGLLVQNDITTVDQLAGKRIGLLFDDLSHFFVKYILKKNNISLESVTFVTDSVDRLAHSFINNELDAVMLWEPWLSKTAFLSNGKILYTSSDYPVLVDVLITRTSYKEQHLESLPQLEYIWNTSITSYHQSRNESIELTASSMGLSVLDLKQQLQGVHFYTSSEQIEDAIVEEIEKFA